jgi:hypothetical protein
MSARQRPSAAIACAVALQGIAAFVAPSTATAAGGWSCEASAVSGTLAGVGFDPLRVNGGAASCGPASAGLAGPGGLPPGISLAALSADTTVDGSGAGTAGAAGGAADVGVGVTPELAQRLPAPDLGTTTLSITIPPLGPTVPVDLRPALEALLQPLPAMELVRARGVRAEAAGTCAGGRIRLDGSAAVAALTVAGQPARVDAALTRAVTLVDTQTIDPSAIDTSKVGLPAGTSRALVQPLLGPALDALPSIAVPATVADVAVTPGHRVETAGRITQRGLRVRASAAGQPIADLTIGEASVGAAGVDCPQPVADRPAPPSELPAEPFTDATAAAAAPEAAAPAGDVAGLALRCTQRRIVLIDVIDDGRRVRLAGAADRRYAGRRVAIRLAATGRVVARPVVGPDGLFSATAPLPARAVRATNRARYTASMGSERSLSLKLARRMVVRRAAVRDGEVTLRGRLSGPLPARPRPIVVRERVSCRRWRAVARVIPGRDGAFSVTVPAPPDGAAAVYRLQTEVALHTARTRLAPTFTLPHYVATAGPSRTAS